METLLGGVEVRGLKDRLGNPLPDQQVRQLPLSAMSRYLLTQNDEAAQCDLLCGQAAGWGDTLHLDSVEAIIEAGDRVNADFFARWLRLRLRRTQPNPDQPSPDSAETSPSPGSEPSKS